MDHLRTPVGSPPVDAPAPDAPGHRPAAPTDPQTAQRIMGGALTVCGLAVCHLARPMVDGSEGTVFLLIGAIGAALILFTRGIGATLGAGLGAVTGLSLTIALALGPASTPVDAGAPALPPANALAFALITIAITGLLGFVGGGWGADASAGSTAAPGPADPTAAAAGGNPFAAALRAAHHSAGTEPARRPAHTATTGATSATTGDVGEPLTGLLRDFSAWLEELDIAALAAQLGSAGGAARLDPRAAAAPCGAEDAAYTPLWAAFDQFARTALGARLGAVGVRCYHVRPDGKLSALSDRRRDRGPRAVPVPTESPAREPSPGPAHAAAPAALDADPIIRTAVAKRRVHVSHAPGATGTPGRLTWVLPVGEGRRVCGVVTVERFERVDGEGRPAADVHETSRAAAVSALLGVFWRHVRDLHLLAVGLGLDRASGVLNRAELLAQARHALRDSLRNGEPVMMMGIAIEGLRGLDDAGDYSRRDALIGRLGEVLCRKLRSDDLVGRFADDRFIVLLRRLDGRLGRLIAENLLQALRGELALLDVPAPGPRTAVTVRAGLVAGPAPADRERGDSQPDACVDQVLSRTLVALDQARRLGLELATDPAGLDAHIGERRVGDGVGGGAGAPDGDPVAGERVPDPPAAPRPPAADAPEDRP